MSFLSAAFIVLWLIVGLYVAFLWARQRRIERELSLLEEELKEARQRRKQRDSL